MNTEKDSVKIRIRFQVKVLRLRKREKNGAFAKKDKIEITRAEKQFAVVIHIMWSP